MKKFLTFILALILTLSFVSCNKNEDAKKKTDLENYVVLEKDGFKVTAAMYAFFLYDYVGAYSDYLYYYGYDTTLNLTEQTSTCAFDESKTWFEYFCSMTEDMLKECLASASAAKAAGISLTEEDLKEIDDYIKEMNDYAIQMGISGVDGLLEQYYVEGITTSTFRACIELQQLAYAYIEKYQSDYEQTITHDALVSYREAHPEEFLKIDYTHYTFFASYEKDATDDEKNAAYAAAKAEAEAFMSSYNTKQSFRDAIVELENQGVSDPYAPDVILYDYIVEGEMYDKDGAEADDTKAYYEWAYSTERKAGDMYIGEGTYSNGEKYYTVYMIDTPVHYDDYVTKNVRHILCYVDTDLSGDELTEAINEAYKKANDLLDEFNAGEKTDAAFAELANKNSDDSDGTDGGLYENVVLGYMVEEFEDWIYDPARKVGDTGIVQTEYGYHVMYFVGDGENTWESVAKEGVLDEAYEAHMKELTEAYQLTFDKEAISQIP